MNSEELAEWIRLPDRWEAVKSYCDYHDLYRAIVAEAPEGSCLVEVGSLVGGGVCFLGHLARDSGKGLRVVAVDHCTGSAGPDDGAGVALAAALGGSFAGILCRNIHILKLQDLVSVVVAPSVAAARLFADGSLHMVMVDGSHEREDVARDLDAWGRKVAPGGWLVGHDISDSRFPGVREAVEAAFPGRWEVSPHAATCWQVRV